MNEPDDALKSAVARLSPRERECLRLVAQHMRSKEIGRRLGISSHTVDSYVNEARRRLEAVDRREAALMVMAAEAPEAAPLNDLGGRPSRVSGQARAGFSFLIEEEHHAENRGQTNGAAGDHSASRRADAQFHLGGTGGGHGLHRGQPAPAGHDAFTGIGNPQAGAVPAAVPGVAGDPLASLGHSGRILWGDARDLTPARRFTMILAWAVLIGLLSLGAIVASHGFTSAVQDRFVQDDRSPARR
jgi:DNA-binding CsgD family transcriptional regulator